jgi:hypothetical protein
MTRASVQSPAGNLQPLRTAALALLRYCQSRDWAGGDPYDALNSRVFQALPLLHFRAARLVFTQLLKRSPINLRPLLLAPPTQNPKGIALFISAILKLGRLQLVPIDLSRDLVANLLALRSNGYPHWCWGYPFAWQSRAALFPRWLPNIICTTFAANALLDAYEEFKDPACVEAAVSAADFLLDALYHEEGPLACFSYMPLARSKVHNANLLGAAFLCRVTNATGKEKYLAPALKAARFSVAHQHPDGSWDYGESDQPPQRWKDSFHTGYNLCALRILAENAGTREFEDALRRGFDFFRQNFFLADGTPKYYHDRAYPIDIHCAAQAILTLLSLKDLDTGNVALAQSVCRWSLQNLHSKEGYFYFQKHPFYTNRIPYMRWSEAWMLLALSMLLEEGSNVHEQESRSN